MSTITFETGIEPPSQIENRFREMKPGESAFLPDPLSKMLHREFMAECKRNKWHGIAETRTENGIAGIRVWRIEKQRTAAETDVMQRVAGLLSEQMAALTIREIAQKCRAFRRLDADERVQLMEEMVECGYCTDQNSSQTTRYRR